MSDNSPSDKSISPFIDFEFIGGVSISDFSIPHVTSWLKSIAVQENKQIDTLYYHFCDDEFLLALNKKYLDHDTLTDIITFPYSYDPIQSDIYISVERVKENANLYGHSKPHHELLRVISHGLLHLCGYNDKSSAEESEMRRMETLYVDMYFRDFA